MTVQEYRDHPSVNFSLLRHILKSSGHFLAANRGKVEPTTPMLLGTMLHKWWLEGEVMPYVTKPAGMSFATKEGKAWRDDIGPQRMLNHDDAILLAARCAALKDSTLANKILDDMPHRERPLFGNIKGVEVKVLPDAFGEVGALDLKTTQDNSPRQWGITVLERDYDLQAALYLEVLRQNYSGITHWWWVTVGAGDFPACVTYNLAPFGMGGEDKLDQAITRLIALRSVDEDTETAIMPAWAVND